MTAFPKPEPDESFHLRLPRELIERIDEKAAEEDRNRANMIRVLLREALEAREEKKARKVS